MKNKYTFDNEITAIKIDGDSTWIATKGDSQSTIYRYSTLDLDILLYSIDINVTEITKIIVDTDNVYVSAISDNYIGVLFDKDDPINVISYFDKPIGINESAIDLISDDVYLYFLVPGILSGENTKLLKYELDGTYIETIDLIKSALTITNATKLDIDESGNLWITLNEDPISIVKVFDSGGWNFEKFILS